MSQNIPSTGSKETQLGRFLNSKRLSESELFIINAMKSLERKYGVDSNLRNLGRFLNNQSEKKKV